jgi:hypothetical protein
VRTTGQPGLVVNRRPRNDIGDSSRERRAHTKHQAVSKGVLEALEQVATIRVVRKKCTTEHWSVWSSGIGVVHLLDVTYDCSLIVPTTGYNRILTFLYCSGRHCPPEARYRPTCGKLNILWRLECSCDTRLVKLVPANCKRDCYLGREGTVEADGALGKRACQLRKYTVRKTQ